MIYIVTAVHNRRQVTERFIEQIKSQNCSGIVVLLVDDGSTDGTSDMVKEIMPEAIILKGNGNLYWAGALHMAYKWLKRNALDDSYIMFANDDTIFDNNYVACAIKHLKDEKASALITGRGYDSESGQLSDGAVLKDFRDAANDRFLSQKEVGNCASTRSLFFSIQTMKKIGGFHPILLPHYGSDYEWTIRAARKGFPILSFDDLKYSFDKSNGKKDGEKSLRDIMKKGSKRNPFYVLSYILLTTKAKDIPFQIASRLQRLKRKIESANDKNRN